MQMPLIRCQHILKAVLLVFGCGLLTACLGGIWSGANLLYDRHSVYHSLTDLEIDALASRALYAQDDYFDCPQCHLDLAVFNGDVLLAGHLENAEMRNEAYKRLEADPRYRRLFKEVSIKPIRTNITKDTWITSKIRSQIMVDSEIDPRTFKVVTSDQVVYLMGDVIPKQAEWVISIARNTSGVLRVVKLFKYYNLSDNAVGSPS